MKNLSLSLNSTNTVALIHSIEQTDFTIKQFQLKSEYLLKFIIFVCNIELYIMGILKISLPEMRTPQVL